MILWGKEKAERALFPQCTEQKGSELKGTYAATL